MGETGGMLKHHSITTALAAYEHAPLSRKRAMLLALLIDAAIEDGADDPLAARAAVIDPALALVIELCAMRPEGPRLVLEAVAITAAEAGEGREADYMVSLYNKGTVQRVRMAWPDGRREDALSVLRQAVAALER
jgi:hypothetical protein